MAVFVIGGVVAVAGYHQKIQNVHDNAPNPLLGTIIAGIGLFIVAVGLVLVVDVVV